MLTTYVFLSLLTLLDPIPSINQDDSSFNGLIRKAKTYSYKEPEMALHYSYRALSEAQKQNNIEGEIHTLLQIGELYRNLGAFRVSFEYYSNAYVICNKKNKILYANVCKSLSQSYNINGDYDQAITILEEAIAISISENDSLLLAQCYNQKGLIHLFRDTTNEYKIYLNNALKINRKLNNRFGIAQNINNLCILRGDSKANIKLLKEAISINTEDSQNWALAENYNNMGMQYFYMNDYQKAMESLDIAEQYAQKYGAKDLLCDNYRDKGKLFIKLNKYKEALIYVEKLRDLEKDIYYSQKNNELRHIDSDRNYKLQQQELKIKDQNSSIAFLKGERMMLFFVIFVILILVIVSILFRILIGKKNNMLFNTNHDLEALNLALKNSYETLTNQKKQIYDLEQNQSKYAYYIINRNDLLRKITQEIRNLTTKDDAEQLKTRAKKINLFISQNLLEDESLNTFIKGIETFNTSFLERLTLKHPDLSKNEKELSSMIRIGLSSREISILHGVEQKAISVARYRMRKRLGLDSESNLLEYIMSI